LQKWVFARADLVNAVSIPLKEKIELIEPRARIVVKSMGADENIFRPVDGARECLGINAETKVLLFVGRFSEKKGIPFLLAAMKILEKRFSRIRLLLIGKGNLEEELRAFVVGNGLDEVVDFQGIVRNEELPLYYSAADLLVVPSVAGIGGQEGLPVAIMEGLLCGKKIVTTKVGGIIELSDLKAIFFTEQRDAKSLAETIEQALQDKSVSPEDARREGLRFSGRGIAHSFIGFYSELAMGN
jgi:glycosyltransferase involved in cell wall biosynthesis